MSSQLTVVGALPWLMMVYVTENVRAGVDLRRDVDRGDLQVGPRHDGDRRRRGATPVLLAVAPFSNRLPSELAMTSTLYRPLMWTGRVIASVRLYDLPGASAVKLS